VKRLFQNFSPRQGPFFATPLRFLSLFALAGCALFPLHAARAETVTITGDTVCGYFNDYGSGRCQECTPAKSSSCAIGYIEPSDEIIGHDCEKYGNTTNRYTVIKNDIAPGQTAGLPAKVETNTFYGIDLYVDRDPLNRFAADHVHQNTLVPAGTPVPTVYQYESDATNPTFISGDLQIVSYGPATKGSVVPYEVPLRISEAHNDIMMVNFASCSGLFDALPTLMSPGDSCNATKAAQNIKDDEGKYDSTNSSLECRESDTFIIGDDIIIPRGAILPAGTYIPVDVTDLWGNTYPATSSLPSDVVVGVDVVVPELTELPKGPPTSMAFYQNIIQKPKIPETPICTQQQINSGNTSDCKIALEEGIDGPAATPGSDILPDFGTSTPNTDTLSSIRPEDLFPYFRGTNSSTSIPPTCSPKAMDVIEARAWAEAQREMAQNQNLISKSDSILEYTCFDRFLEVFADKTDASYMFSENDDLPYSGGITDFAAELHLKTKLLEASLLGKLDPAGTAGLDMNSVLELLVLDTLVEDVTKTDIGDFCRTRYIDDNFNHNFLGGRSLLSNNIGHSVSDTSTYSCTLMSQIWNAAKCNNAMRYASDGFFTFEEYKDAENNDQDFRQFPKRCKVGGISNTSEALCTTDFNAQNNLFLAAVGIDFGTLTWDAALLAAFPEGGMHGAHDALRSYVERLDPDNCAALEPIKLGFKVTLDGELLNSFDHNTWRKDGTSEYEDAICVAPGCWYDPNSNTCESDL
jgi:hypothetical protein